MFRETIELGGREVTFEVGAVARQASGSVLVTAGETVILAVVTAERRPTKLDYMPLTTEYRNRYAAAGKIPGSYDRRETRPTELETLTSRLIDRSVRPLFPDGWNYDTQLLLSPYSYDPVTDVPALAISAGAAALLASDIPWEGPVAGVRIGRRDGRLVAFPAPADLEAGGLDLVITLSREGIVMVEGGADEVSEELVVEAFALAQQAGAPLLELLGRLGAAAPRKRAVQPPAVDLALRERVEAAARAGLEAALATAEKHARHDAVAAAGEAALEALGLGPAADPLERAAAKEELGALEKRLIREGVLRGQRLGGRGPADIREITGRVGWLPSCHGSSLFTRGETQAIVTCTLGTERESQSIETLDGEQRQRFLLHYNFPPYSVGEVKPLRGPGRREIGHGHLARRALRAVLPGPEVMPYTVRLESTITESNGSSSMATICGGTLALMDTGIPLRRPVAGIAMGLVAEGEQVVVISDILGDEDHVGDMDFKVAGTTEGITAIQLDNKLGAVPEPVMRQALSQARAGRLHILGVMGGILAGPRPQLNPRAPQAATVRIERNRIRDLIGPGGRNIQGVQAQTATTIEVTDDGLVRIYARDARSLAEARARVEDLTGIPEVGRTYAGRVVAVKHFGSFVRLFEGIEGLVAGVELTEGAEVSVVVSGVNEQGKLSLRRA